MNVLDLLKRFDYLVPWLNLTSSLFLAIITLWYVAITAKTLRQTQAVENDRQERTKREQAAAIAAWVTGSKVDGDRAAIEITVRNPTEQPIYGLELGLIDVSGGQLPGSISTHPLLGPGEQRRVEARLPIPENASGDLRVAAKFVDASGLVWLRDADGILTQDDPGRSVRSRL